MITDARTISDGEQIEADLCIIGAGPAGLSIAHELRNSRLRICLLESGGKTLEPAAQRLNDGESVGYPYYPLRTARARGFGGTSNSWYQSVGLRARPLDELDFEARPELPYSGWPFDKAALDPYYERAQRLCKLGPYNYDLEFWNHDGGVSRLPSFGNDLVTTIFQFAPPDAYLSYWDEIRSTPNLRLLLNATALEIETAVQPGEVSGVRVAGAAGGSFSVRAKHYVLAVGGIENARLLLLSRSTHPNGLGNQHDLVGRFFMEHLGVDLGLILPPSPTLYAATRLFDTFTAAGTRVSRMLSVRQDVLRREGLLNSTLFVRPLSRTRAADGVRSLQVLKRALRYRPLPDHLAQHTLSLLANAGTVWRTLRRRPRGGVPEPVQLRAMAEQAPNPNSRVSLSRQRDAFGRNRVLLDWRLSPLDVDSLRRTQEVIDRTLQQAGIGRLEGGVGDEKPPALFNGEWHHMGTTRMHRDPRQGVVDPNGRVHGVGNLFVTGSSLFPTGGYANPTLTAVALAVRLADHLAQQISGSPVRLAEAAVPALATSRNGGNHAG